MPTTPSTMTFLPGDLVLSIYGDGDGSGSYTDNQAAPVTLEQVTTSGSYVSDMVLPQTTTMVNGVTEYAFSGEYGSSSEGTLELSEDGESLVIAGYAVNAATYNQNGATVYGNAALAQSTSVQGGQYIAVARAIADISYTGTVDTSTAVYNVADGNNPRSVATVNGSTFYLSGQGQSGDTTQGLFEVADGASTATSIDHSTDTRTVEIYDNELYLSRDSKQPKPSGTSNIADYGTTLPTSATAPTVLTGISQTITLTAAEENTVNAADVGKTVHLSPENFFFANADTLYVADGGNPKEGGLGDGGLQKWTYNGTKWTLAYTLSAGLGLVPDTASSGTTGLIGLTGNVVDNTVYLYATNSTLGDLDPTYLYGITDSLSSTTGAGESFTTLVTAAADTNIRGVAFAPAPCYCPGTLILTDRGEMPVEALAIGDRVITVAGAAEPIVWIGRRSYAGRFITGRTDLLPIVIQAGALGGGLPRRDLRVSPLHAMFFDGVLVPAGQLTNGSTIYQDMQCRRVEYIHVELAAHDVIWAEGAASESFVDDDSRAMFQNAPEYAALYPDAQPVPAQFCAPRLEDGYEVEAIRQRIAAVARQVKRAA